MHKSCRNTVYRKERNENNEIVVIHCPVIMMRFECLPRKFSTLTEFNFINLYEYIS